MFFSVITKNLNWKILTKNLVTFKRWDEVLRLENLNIMEIHSKIQFLVGREGGFIKNQYIGGNFLKKGRGLNSLQIYRDVGTPMHTMIFVCQAYWSSSRNISCLSIQVKRHLPFFRKKLHEGLRRKLMAIWY